MTTDMKLPLVASMDQVPFSFSGEGYTVDNQQGDWVALCHDLCQAQEIAKRVNAYDGLVEALRFILAFYEPGQTHLDTEAWKLAEAGGRAALAGAA